MFFSLYQSQNISSLKQSSPKLLTEAKNKTPDIKESINPKKDIG
jgi:hypothetical protein